MLRESQTNNRRLKTCYFGSIGSKPLQDSDHLKAGDFPNDNKYPTSYNGNMIGHLLPNMRVGDSRNPPNIGATRFDIWLTFLERNNTDGEMDFSYAFFSDFLYVFFPIVFVLFAIHNTNQSTKFVHVPVNNSLLTSAVIAPATFMVTCTLQDLNAMQRKKDPSIPQELEWVETNVEMICMSSNFFSLLVCQLSESYM